jgi:hypothetical protein
VQESKQRQATREEEDGQKGRDVGEWGDGWAVMGEELVVEGSEQSSRIEQRPASNFRFPFRLAQISHFAPARQVSAMSQPISA